MTTNPRDPTPFTPLPNLATPARYQEAYTQLLNFAKSLMSSRTARHTDPEDIVQQAILEVERRHGEHAMTSDAIRKSLFATVKRRVVDAGRQARKPLHYVPNAKLTQQPLLQRASGTVTIADLFEHVLSAVDRLPPIYSESFRLRLVHRLEYSEIAAKLGISKDNARRRCRRASDMLRRKLGPL